MRVLVTTASRHGSTTEIGERIADVLRTRGHEATSTPMHEVNETDAEAFVLGCAIYMGQWIGEGRTFVDTHEDLLKTKPCWIFSSGPTGDPPKPDEIPPAHDKVMERIKPRDGRVFPGSLDMDELGFAEKLVVKVVHAGEGDFRPWDEIDAFANQIADELDAMHPEQA